MKVHFVALCRAGPVSPLAKAAPNHETKPSGLAAFTRSQSTRMNVNGHAARIQPIVPPMRTIPNSFLASVMLANAIEFVMEIVGTYKRQWTNINEKKGQNGAAPPGPGALIKARPSIASPPIKWLNARKRSAEK